VDIFNR